jgi:hypothetical protein
MNASYPISYLVEEKMNKFIQKLSLSISKIDRRHIQLLIVLVTLSLLVLGAGAPAISGGSGGG